MIVERDILKKTDKAPTRYLDEYQVETHTIFAIKCDTMLCDNVFLGGIDHKADEVAIAASKDGWACNRNTCYCPRCKSIMNS